MLRNQIPESPSKRRNWKQLKCYVNNRSTKENASPIDTQSRSISNNRISTLTGYDKTSILRLKLLIQTTQMSEYENWLNTLLSLWYDKTGKDDNLHMDIGTPIQKALEKVRNLQENNIKIKEKIIYKMIENDALINELNALKNEKLMISKEVQYDNYSQLYKERDILVNNIQIIANEWDDLSVKYQTWKQKARAKAKNSSADAYEKTFEQYNAIKEENNKLLKMLELRTKYYVNFDKEAYKKEDKRIAVSTLGNYTLEKEEEIIENIDGNYFGIFGCAGR